MESKIIISRFEIKEKLGEGSFSKIFKAFDNLYKRDVALKVEKKDKSQRILKFEYKILKNLQGLSVIPRVYDLVENPQSNFIVMELLGMNIASLKKSLGTKFTDAFAYDILIQMLNCIEDVHNKGYIHRDIKPSNFVICPQQKKVYMVDFGLAKLHINKKGQPFTERKNADFRGTIAFASMNAHNQIDLSRRDDLWSFFFVILDLLGEIVPWRKCGEDKNEIKLRKNEFVNNPFNLLKAEKCNHQNFNEIYNHIKSLRYLDKPNYNLIRNKLQELLNAELINLSIKDPSFCSYLKSDPFSHKNLFNQEKDNNQSLSVFSYNNVLLQDLFKKSANLLNELFNKLEMDKQKEDHILLQIKRLRNESDSKNLEKEIRSSDMRKSNEKNSGFNYSLPNSLMNYDEYNLLNYMNDLNVYQNPTNNIDYDIYSKINSISDWMNIQKSYTDQINTCFNKCVTGQMGFIDQCMNFQYQMHYYNNFLSFPI